jgi:hypothetical protein
MFLIISVLVLIKETVYLSEGKKAREMAPRVTLKRKLGGHPVAVYSIHIRWGGLPLGSERNL